NLLHILHRWDVAKSGVQEIVRLTRQQFEGKAACLIPIPGLGRRNKLSYRIESISLQLFAVKLGLAAGSSEITLGKRKKPLWCGAGPLARECWRIGGVHSPILNLGTRRLKIQPYVSFLLQSRAINP